MKTSRIIHVVVILIFCFAGIAFSDGWKGESGKRGQEKTQYNQSRQNKNERSDHRDSRSYKDRRDTQDHRGDSNHRDYNKHNGYSARPYGKNRRYDHYAYKGHRYDYHGHWKSWKQWDKYAKNHPDLYKHGHYYRENSHLMFRFCDPLTGACFFFSIGR